METEDDNKWEKQRAAMKKNLESLAKSTKSKVVKNIVDERKVRDDVELQGKIMTVRRVVDESIEAVNEGEMSFEKAMKELSELIIKI